MAPGAADTRPASPPSQQAPPSARRPHLAWLWVGFGIVWGQPGSDTSHLPRSPAAAFNQSISAGAFVRWSIQSVGARGSGQQRTCSIDQVKGVDSGQRTSSNAVHDGAAKPQARESKSQPRASPPRARWLSLEAEAERLYYLLAELIRTFDPLALARRSSCGPKGISIDRVRLDSA